MRTEKKYKMRAECCADLGRFLMEIQVMTFVARRAKITGEGLVFPDMEVEFTSTMSLEEISYVLKHIIVDGHVMLRTIELLGGSSHE